MINPYQIVSTDGRYYHICNYDKYDNLSHYRLDRIRDLKILEEVRKETKKVKGLERGLDLAKHMEEHIYMFTGDSIIVTLKFKDTFLNEFIDWFGTKNIRFIEQKNEKLIVEVDVNKIAMRKWALQYALHVRVLSPEILVEEIRNDINKAGNNYKK